MLAKNQRTPRIFRIFALSLTTIASKLAPTVVLQPPYRALCSRPRSNWLGIAIAAANPSKETAALTISK